MFGGFWPCAWHKDEAGVWSAPTSMRYPSHLLFMLPTTDEKTFSIRQVLTCERALGAILLHNPAQFTGLVVR